MKRSSKSYKTILHFLKNQFQFLYLYYCYRLLVCVYNLTEKMNKIEKTEHRHIQKVLIKLKQRIIDPSITFKHCRIFNFKPKNVTNNFGFSIFFFCFNKVT